jgi:hypothetical protein
VDAAGNALVVWDQNNAFIYANRYRAATGTWDASAQLIGNNAGALTIPQVAVDAMFGTIPSASAQRATAFPLPATATCGKNMARVRPSNNYVPNQGWSVAQRVEASAGEIALNPWWRVAMDGSGNAFAAWIQRGGTNNSWSVYASRGH